MRQWKRNNPKITIPHGFSSAQILVLKVLLKFGESNQKN